MIPTCAISDPALEHTIRQPDEDMGNLWKSLLHERLNGQPYPLFVFAGSAGERLTIPAASLWSGARLWIHAFRDAGLRAGDRFVIALPPSPAFVQVLIAALWEGLTIAPVPITDNIEGAFLWLDAQGGVTTDGTAGTWKPDGCSGPDLRAVPMVRPKRHPATADICFLLRTSGTTSMVPGNPSSAKWVALSSQNVLAVLNSHSAVLDLREAESRFLSVLPWHHAFGLVLDLLIGLFAGVEMVRDEQGGRDIPALLALAEEMGSTHFSTVPLVCKRIAQCDEGRTFLKRLSGGAIGGAPINGSLAAVLRETNLRAGYGQTEAAPGIALGEPGYFPAAGYLGRPLGCTTRINANGILEFAGANVSIGTWTVEGLERRFAGDVGNRFLATDEDVSTDTSEFVLSSGNRFLSTGDMVRQDSNGDLYFLGRVDDQFKLTNGRLVEAGYWETRLRQEFPTLIEDVFVFTPGGESLAVAVLPFPESSAQVPTLSEFAAPLEHLGKLLRQVYPLPANVWRYTPKGNLNRRLTERAIRTTLGIELP